MEDNGSVVGLCKKDICGSVGRPDNHDVLKEYRGKGYGKALMDWAMSYFDRNGVHHIEVKVVDGNEAIHLNEKYGFKMNAYILVNNR